MPDETQKQIDDAVQMALLVEQNKVIQRDLAEVKDLLKSHYVTIEEFKPVKQIVYGMVSVILTAILVALVALIVK